MAVQRELTPAQRITALFIRLAEKQAASVKRAVANKRAAMERARLIYYANPARKKEYMARVKHDLAALRKNSVTKNSAMKEAQSFMRVVAALYESCDVKNGVLALRTRPIFINYMERRYALGKIRASIEFKRRGGSEGIRIAHPDNGYPIHPHGGNWLCPGNMHYVLKSDAKAHRWANVAATVYTLLHTYTPGGAPHSIGQWDSEPLHDAVKNL